MLAMILISGITYKILAQHAEAIAEITEGGTSLPLSGSAFMLAFLSSSNFSLITAIFVAIAVCGDYDAQIVKNVYARGYSRGQCYFSKMIYTFTAATIMFAALFAASALIGAAVFGLDDVQGKTFLLVAMQYIVSMAEVALYFAISSSIRKLGGSIPVCIFAPMLISLLLELADTALKTDGFKVASVWFSSFEIDLTNIAIGTERIVVCAVLSVVYAAAFIVIGYAINRKTEI